MKEDLHCEITTTIKVSFSHNIQTYIILYTITEPEKSDYDNTIDSENVFITENIIPVLPTLPLLPLNKFYINATSQWLL